MSRALTACGLGRRVVVDWTWAPLQPHELIKERHLKSASGLRVWGAVRVHPQLRSHALRPAERGRRSSAPAEEHSGGSGGQASRGPRGDGDGPRRSSCAPSVGVLGTGVPRLACLRPAAWLKGGPARTIFINTSSRPSQGGKPHGTDDKKLPRARPHQAGSRGGGEIKAGYLTRCPVTPRI